MSGIGPCGVCGVDNFTMTGSVGAGFATVWPYNLGHPGTSNVNVAGAGQDAASFSITQVATQRVKAQSSVGTQFIADLFGWFTL